VVILLVSGYRPFPPSIYGKLTTASEIILVFLIVLGAAYPDYRVALLNHFFIYAVTVLSIVSGFHYSFTTTRRLSSSAPEAR
jgi:phosphatidylglycerophosphate synthase